MSLEEIRAILKNSKLYDNIIETNNIEDAEYKLCNKKGKEIKIPLYFSKQ